MSDAPASQGGWLSFCLLEWLPFRWRLIVFALAGVAAGLGLWTARMANAAAYLSDDPAACINCHVMTDAYASWERGSHGRATVCNDCHVPHTNPIAMAAFKARDGMRHATLFTLRLEPQVLELSAAARHVVQGNCLRCHAEMFGAIRLAGVDERPCWTCHHNVHGRARSLSASPHVLRPALPSAGLGWMD
ncbi:MAG TPA: cytochrome c nitrite reductase small subunit [Myxococcota bacterium]|nr:cytochrome c nitrite reductase small subunit [Myxococcota bacterium]HRY93453.1 cytochrome c nitrite reductase small subunit [Myxococcota bacterium]HSA20300.1 cytochrome c nitrite reductase small subunit [Myxococcota bacterium]